MPRQRGKPYNLTCAFQRIDRAISSLNGECFTPQEIYQITGLRNRVVAPFLSLKVRKGFLERIRRGCYKKILNEALTKRLPSAFIATKVWRILSRSEKPLTNREISEIITEDTGFDLYFNIGTLLMNWCRRNALDKLGGKKPYAYQIKPDFKDKDRPIATSPF